MHDNEQPRVLYKYCPPERMDVLRNRLVRFTQREDLNDIYEMRPAINFNHAAYQAARESVAETNPEILDLPAATPEENRNDLDEVLKEVLVLSLSSKWDIIPMWSYYADGHKGLVIGFDFNDPFLKGYTTRPVEYTATFPVIGYGVDLGSTIFHKFEQWEHEHEWRSMRVLGHDVQDQTLCDHIHLFRFSPKALVEFILGHRMAENDKCQIREILKDPAYDHVKVFEAYPDENAWMLQRREFER